MHRLCLLLFSVLFIQLSLFTVQAKLSIKSGKSSINGKKSLSQNQLMKHNDKSVSVIANGASPIGPGPLCILGGALAHLALGTLYCWGNFISYIPPELRFFDGQIKDGSPDALFVVPLTMVAQSLSMPFGPRLVSKIGAAKAQLFGVLLAASGVYFSSYFVKDLAKFMFFYSFIFGGGMGLAYTAAMSAGWKWMPSAKGLVSGGILAGFGSGGFIFSMIGSKIANPDKANKDASGLFPSSVYENFPTMLKKLSMCYAALSIIGSSFVSEPAATPVQKGKKPTTATGATVKEALTSWQYWLMWSMVVLSATAGLNTASVYKTFASSSGSSSLKDDAFLALCGGIGALFNGSGRLGWGLLSDVIGFKNSYTILTIFQTISMLTYEASANSKSTFMMNTCALFFCLAGNLALMPSAVQRMFGPMQGATIYGFFFSAFAVASICGGFLTKALAAQLGWGGVFRVMAAMSVLASLLNTRLKSLPEAYSAV